MYPQKLYLKNFLSYGPQGIDIDFSIYQTVLLIGANGAGKSSILDAILWSLWGKTRFGSDTDIMHSGSSDMEVRLDFSVQGHTYRIIRKRSKKGKGFVSVLELQSLTEPITVLTDATISKTQERVDELVGVSYELLTSSAFLKQGDAGEFTHKSPSKRKELLSSILHLERYQAWQETSKLELKTIENELLANQGQKSYLQVELTRLLSQVKELERLLVSPDISHLEKEIAQIQLEIKKHEDNLRIQKEKTDQIAFIQSTLDQNSNKLVTTQKRLKELQTIKTRQTDGNKEVLPVDQSELSTLIKNAETLQQLQAQTAAEEQTIKFLQQQLDQLSRNYVAQMEACDKEINKLESSPAIQAYRKESTRQIVHNADEVKQNISSQNQQLIDLSERIAAIEQELQMTVNQGNQIKAKREKLEQLDHNCPLCEQEINDAHKKDIASKYETERAELLVHYNELKVKKDIITNEKDALAIKLRNLQDDLEQIQNAQEAILLMEQINTTKQRKTDTSTTYHEQKDQLEKECLTTEARRNELIIRSEKFKNVKSALSTLQEQDNLFRQQQERNLALQGIYKEIEIIEELLRSLEVEQEELVEKLSATKALLISDATTPQTLSNLQIKANQIIDQRDILKQQQRMLAHLKQEIERIEATIAQQNEQNDVLLRNQEVLSTLVDAFGYKGIPTMIIEEAIPRLEQYANDILSFLSDNTMSIRFSLTRMSKTDKDNQIETLDILIGDTFGTRAYELFSGGEAFRIDIALRLALTKLLTERSNGKIDFLVIDEGFGSQDEGGKDHVMQIIHKLEKFFKLIIIITHVDSLKETFPDRLLVRKGPHGSEVVIDHED